eukprot:scaffold48615_cov64-Phaeocystis_antarctica.AAC.1
MARQSAARSHGEETTWAATSSCSSSGSSSSGKCGVRFWRLSEANSTSEQVASSALHARGAASPSGSAACISMSASATARRAGSAAFDFCPPSP